MMDSDRSNPRGRWQYDEETDTFTKVPKPEPKPEPPLDPDEHPGQYL